MEKLSLRTLEVQEMEKIEGGSYLCVLAGVAGVIGGAGSFIVAPNPWSLWAMVGGTAAIWAC